MNYICNCKNKQKKQRPRGKPTWLSFRDYIYVNIETLTEPVILGIFCAIPNNKETKK